MVLVGPSGCGKTTALRMLAGLEEISEGEIRIGDRIVNDLTPKDRDIAMVFQSYALYPHMTVEQNLAFGLKLRKLPKKEIKERVQRAAKILQIEEFLKRKPRALSGGQRQRVAMGRAIVREPQAFLMDEPLSNLDAKLRVQLRAEIHQLQRRLGVTTIYVTHDQVEAMTMGDRVAVMNAGHLQQVDTPQVLYDSPVNEFVAGFIGSPSINLVEAELEQAERQPPGQLRRPPADRRRPGRPQPLAASRTTSAATVILGHPPRGLRGCERSSPTRPPTGASRSSADLTEPLGSEVLVHFGTEATDGHLERRRGRRRRGRRRLVRRATEDASASTRLVARVSPKSRIAVGSEIELAVDTTRLYFFDPRDAARRSSP